MATMHVQDCKTVWFFQEMPAISQEISKLLNIFLLRQSLSVGWIQHVDCQLEISYLKNPNTLIIVMNAYYRQSLSLHLNLFTPFLVPCPSLSSSLSFRPLLPLNSALIGRIEVLPAPGLFISNKTAAIKKKNQSGCLGGSVG